MMATPLLRWGIENSDTNILHEEAEKQQVKKFDPELIEFILGKDDAVRMKECVVIIQDEMKSLEERLVAFDHLELLVEQIDNACNMEKMQLWTRLLPFLQSEEESLRKATLWVAAVCAQNNPEAQDALLKHDILKLALKMLLEDSSKSVRHKTVHVMSAMVQHHETAFSTFLQMDGLATFEKALITNEYDTDLNDRIMFLLLALIEERPEFIDNLSKFPLLKDRMMRNPL